MKNDIVIHTISIYLADMVWHIFLFRICDTLYYNDVSTNINYFGPPLLLQNANINEIRTPWPVAARCFASQVENVQYINSMQMLHRASCTLPTFFMFYELENTIIIKMQRSIHSS